MQALPPLGDASHALRYRGRFAPSPTGRLHFGSLVAAVGSYLDARASGGEWLIRIEDVDAPRTLSGAADAILDTLDALAFEWDGEVVVQSRRVDYYRDALHALQAADDVYPCVCSRREIAARAASTAIDGGFVYPGTCRQGLPAHDRPVAWRLRVPDCPLAFTDRLQGDTWQNLQRDVGDFVVLRADGLFAYQLAVVVDDAAQQVTQVVRGADLLDSTLRQIWLQQRLGLPTPVYAHLPVATNPTGEKLSKQTHAAAVDASRGSEPLAAALRFLGQVVPPEVGRVAPREFWPWAVANWSLASVPRVRSIGVDQRP